MKACGGTITGPLTAIFCTRWKCWASRPGRFILQETATGSCWREGSVGPRAGVDLKKGSLSPLPGIELRYVGCSARSVVTYTNWLSQRPTQLAPMLGKCGATPVLPHTPRHAWRLIQQKANSTFAVTVLEHTVSRCTTTKTCWREECVEPRVSELQIMSMPCAT